MLEDNEIKGTFCLTVVGEYRAIRYLSLFSCNSLMCPCKSETRVANYCKCKLSRNIEKNPGPTLMYSKIIAAPYIQGNELVFGQNAGQQCVAISSVAK